MTFKLLYTKSALEDVKKLDSVTKKRVKKKVEEYAIHPLAHSKRLTNPAVGTYRWRVGNYRVIFDLDNANIVVLRIRHRREIYRKI